MSKQKLKLFIVNKFVMASSASDALKRERKHRPDNVYLDEEWRKENRENLESAIGFSVEHDYWSSDDWAKKNK